MTQQKKLFPNNKIVESICQLTFSNSQSEELSDGLIKAINSIGTYSIREVIPSIQFIFKAPGIQLNPNAFNALKFSNKEGDKILQLHNDNLSIHQVGKYREWNAFREDIIKGIAAFAEVNPSAVISRIDLRFINAFEFPLDYKPDEYFTVGVHYKRSQLNNKQYNITIEDPLEDKAGQFVVTRFLQSLQKERANVVLDLSFVYLCEENFKIEATDKIFSELDYANSELYLLFSSSITDKLKSSIE